jgi:hypothetical protein
MITVRELQVQDYEPAAGFLAGWPGDPRSSQWWLDRFHFWWDRNPAFVEGIPRGWILLSRDSVEGFVATVPTRFWLDGKESTVLNASTWRVNPERRGLSFQLLANLVNAGKQTLIFDTTPSEHVIPILERLGFRLIPRADVRQTIVVANASRAVRALSGRLPFQRPLTALMSPLATVLLESPRKKPGSTPGGDGSPASIDRAGDDFNELWDRTSTAFAYTNMRTAADINRFCFDDRQDVKQVVGSYDSGRLTGYMVFRIRERFGLKILDCVDAWCEPGIARAVGELMYKAVEVVTCPR